MCSRRADRYASEAGRRQPVEYDFEYDKLKHSTGIAVQWLAPLGLFRFSYAFPMNAYKGDINTVSGRERAIPVLGRPGFLRGNVLCRFRFRKDSLWVR